MQQLNLLELLANLGINGAQITAIVGSIILKTAVEYIPANKNQHKLDKVNWVM